MRPSASAGLDLTPILSLGEQPLANNLVDPANAPPVDASYPLELMWCDELRLVQLSIAAPPDELFSTYLYMTSFSPALVEAAREHARFQISRRGLGAGDLVIEIGSNDGYLLRFYHDAGIDVLGIDPAANVVEHAVAAGVPTRCAFFDLGVAQELKAEGLRPKLVHANNVMAHVSDVDGVMSGVATMLHPDGVFVTETPYVRHMIEQTEFDTIYHEHLYYYSLTSFGRLLERNGLGLVDVEEIAAHGGSLRITAGLPGRREPSAAVTAMLADEEASGMNTLAYYDRFAGRVGALLDELRGLIDSVTAKRETVVAYGAAAKATVLLNALGDTASKLGFVADRSTLKQGRLLPGPRLPIVAPDRIDTERPDYVLVCAWNYFDEIVASLADYRAAGGRFVRPLPVVEVS